jgi:hypothetical protein
VGRAGDGASHVLATLRDRGLNRQVVAAPLGMIRARCDPPTWNRGSALCRLEPPKHQQRRQECRSSADAFRGRFVLGDAVSDPAVPPRHRSVIGRLVYSLHDEGFSETVRKIGRCGQNHAPGRYTDYDEPALLVDQLRWMTDAGLDAKVMWEKDLCVVVRAHRRTEESHEPRQASHRSQARADCTAH